MAIRPVNPKQSVCRRCSQVWWEEKKTVIFFKEEGGIVFSFQLQINLKKPRKKIKEIYCFNYEVFSWSNNKRGGIILRGRITPDFLLKVKSAGQYRPFGQNAYIKHKKVIFWNSYKSLIQTWTQIRDVHLFVYEILFS